MKTKRRAVGALSQRQIGLLRPLEPQLREVLDRQTFDGAAMSLSDWWSCAVIAEAYFEVAR
jgi:hypothetical protein